MPGNFYGSILTVVAANLKSDKGMEVHGERVIGVACFAPFMMKAAGCSLACLALDYGPMCDRVWAAEHVAWIILRLGRVFRPSISKNQPATDSHSLPVYLVSHVLHGTGDYVIR